MRLETLLVHLFSAPPFPPRGFSPVESDKVTGFSLE